MKLHHASITLKEKRILHENSHDNLGWSLPRYHYSPTLTHPFWQGFSLCFLKMPLECPVLLDWLSRTNHWISYKQYSYERNVQIRPSHSVHDLVANNCVPIPNKINLPGQEEGLKLLSVHETSILVHIILKFVLWNPFCTTRYKFWQWTWSMSHTLLAKIWGHHDINIVGGFSPWFLVLQKCPPPHSIPGQTTNRWL